MTTDALEAATLDADPPEDEVTDVGPEDAPTNVAPPAPKPTTMPDEAYKGIQRTLAREQARVRELEANLAQVSNQGVDEQSKAVILALIAEISKHDEAKGNALKAEYDRLLLVQENRVLRNQSETRTREQQLADIEARNVEELRAVVIALGADPDSPAIDYGNSNEWFAERLSRARSTAQEVAVAAKPVKPTPRSAADGTSHNTQPVGTTPTPRPSAKAVTQEDLQAAQRAYSIAYQTNDPKQRVDAEAKLRDLNDRFAKQTFAS